MSIILRFLNRRFTEMNIVELIQKAGIATGSEITEELSFSGVLSILMRYEKTRKIGRVKCRTLSQNIRNYYAKEAKERAKRASSIMHAPASTHTGASTGAPSSRG